MLVSIAVLVVVTVIGWVMSRKRCELDDGVVYDGNIAIHADSGTAMDLGPDPLDPRGEGTIREGDPIYDSMMRCMETGESMFGNIMDDGKWDVEFHGKDA